MSNKYRQHLIRLFLLFFPLPCISFCQVKEKILPESLRSFVLPGYEMLDFIEGDLNADKKPDAILILKKSGEDTVETEELKRPFLLLIRQPDGKLKLEKRNDNLVMCRLCGGIWGNPYEGTELIKNGFTVSFYGGSSWRWSYTFSFVYNPGKRNWFLIKEHLSNYHNTESEINIKEADIEAPELGIVPVEKFTSEPPYADSEWKVIVSKTYFYDNPKLGSKQRKGYLVKGDLVTGIRHLKNFIEVSYENKDQEFTTGYVLKNNLQKIK